MKILEVEVRGDIFSKILLANRFDQVDSLRLTAFLIHILSIEWSNGEFNSFIQNLKNGKFSFLTSSPYFYLEEEFWLPVTFPLLMYLLNFDLSKMEKKIKKIKFFPVFSNKSIEELINKNDEISKKLEKSSIRIRNVISRLTNQSINVYPLECTLVEPFRFTIFYPEIYEEKIKGAILTKLLSLGKRRSLGFGRIYLDEKFSKKFNKVILFDEVDEGLYYLLNRIPITEKILEKIEPTKSYYELVKISGYTGNSLKGNLFGRILFCFKEGSLLYFKKTKFENEFYNFEDKYLVPFRPLLIKFGEKV